MISTLSYENDVVCEPLVCGGTVSPVCKKLGRRFVGSDIEQEYVDTAVYRLDPK